MLAGPVVSVIFWHMITLPLVATLGEQHQAPVDRSGEHIGHTALLA